MSPANAQTSSKRPRVLGHRGGVAAAVALLCAAALFHPGVGADAQEDAEDGAALPRLAFLARADNPVDALAAGAVAGTLGAPVLLTGSAELDGFAADALVGIAPDLVVLTGGIAALSERVAEDVNALGFATRRVAGGGRTETAAAVAALLAELGVQRPLVAGGHVEGDAELAGTFTADQLRSTTTSQPPFAVASSLLVAGLNAEFVGGMSAEDLAGVPGPAGEPGEDGPAGPQGPQGPEGAQGPEGPQGDQGSQGEQGVQGVQGVQGDQGDQGDQGVQGVQGEQGRPGPVVDRSAPRRNTVATIGAARTAGFGSHSAVTIDAFGLPVVAFYDENETALYLARCADAACVSSTVHLIDDGGGNDVGTHVQIALDVEDRLIFAYHDATAGTLRFARCADPVCTTAVSQVIAASAGEVVGTESALVVAGFNERPVVSHLNSTTTAVWITTCEDRDCTSSIHSVRTNSAGGPTAMTVNFRGLPLIVYRNTALDRLDLLSCTDQGVNGCQSATLIPGIDATPGIGQELAMAMGHEGVPYIVARAGTVPDGNQLVNLQCRDATCTAAGGVERFQRTQVTADEDIVIAGNGLPVIGRRAATNSAFSLVVCHDPVCEHNTSIGGFNDGTLGVTRATVDRGLE